MALVDNDITPQVPTKEQKLEQVKTRIKKMSKNIYRQMNNRHQTIWEMIWENPRGLTAQEVLDELGVDAHELFTFSSNIQSMLYQADPENYVILDTPNEYVVNPNGTITIGELRS